MNDVTLPALVKNSSYKILEKIFSVTYEQLEENVKTFVRQSTLRFKAGVWRGNEKPSAAYLSGAIRDIQWLKEAQLSALFTPFVEKNVFPSGAQIAVIGDLHGDIEALVVMLDQLCRDGYLDDNFKIIHDNFYLVFLGDYVNRKPYSVEVMMLLFHLASQNLGKMFLLRGNHEYAVCNKNWYDRYILEGRDEISGQETLLGELAHKFAVYYYPNLLYWYDYLPLICYVGCRNRQTGITHFAQLCHAGIEIGWNPQGFLADREARFQKITQLNRYNALHEISLKSELSALSHHITEMLDYLKRNTNLKSFVETFFSEGSVDFMQDPRVVRLGMQWNNFLTHDNDSLGFGVSIKRRSLYFGSQLLSYCFDQSATSTTKLVSLLRGHQHLNDYDHSIGFASPMLDQIVAGKGLCGQWKGRVYTLGDSGATSGYHSFLIMTLYENLEEWTLKHYFKKVHETVFKTELRMMLA